MDILERLKKVFTNIVDSETDLSEITPETNFVTDLGLNSIAMLYMALAIEEEFKVSLTNGDFSDIKTVGDVITYIERNL